MKKKQRKGKKNNFGTKRDILSREYQRKGHCILYHAPAASRKMMSTHMRLCIRGMNKEELRERTGSVKQTEVDGTAAGTQWAPYLWLC